MIAEMSDAVKEKTGASDEDAEKAAQASALTRIRANLGIRSQTEFADALGVSRQTYQGWEAGKVLAARRLGWLIRRAYPHADISALSETRDEKAGGVREDVPAYRIGSRTAVYRQTIHICGACTRVVAAATEVCPHCHARLGWPARDLSLAGGPAPA